MMMVKRAKNKPTKKHDKSPVHKPQASQQKLPFIAHVYELRRRLFLIALSIVAGGLAAYGVQMQLTKILLRPAGDQQFIYTSPGGGFDFLFKLCLYAGIAVSIPVIVYQLLRYLQPLIKQDATRFIVWGSIASGLLGVCGILFGYFIGLPAAMHFLLKTFTTEQIQALLTIQSYLSFVMAYLLGSALLFQVPLVMLLINKAKPLKPRSLMGFQRWFIVFAFIIGAVINPSPNIQDQLMLSVPMVLMYQLGIVLVWAANRRRSRPRKVIELIHKDEEARAARMAHFYKAQETWLKSVQQATKVPAPAPRPQPVSTPVPRPNAIKSGLPPAPQAMSRRPTPVARPSRIFVQEVTRPAAPMQRPIRPISVSFQE